jgi:3-oxoacyl-[acyl-carrier protein] reductase
MILKDAKILITGGSTGIGLETAKHLLAKGSKVVICSKNEHNILKAAQEIGAIPFVADVYVENDVKKLVAFAVSELKGIDVLINNAGIATFGSITDTSVDDFTKVWATNTLGAFMVAKEVAIHFKNQQSGNIINIASTAASKGFANGSSYCASKFALSALTQCWREELRKFNVRVMQVNPSEVITPFYEKLGMNPNKIEQKLKPKDIAHCTTAMLEMDNVGFVTDTTVWATNPF